MTVEIDPTPHLKRLIITDHAGDKIGIHLAGVPFVRFWCYASGVDGAFTHSVHCTREDIVAMLEFMKEHLD